MIRALRQKALLRFHRCPLSFRRGNAQHVGSPFLALHRITSEAGSVTSSSALVGEDNACFAGASVIALQREGKGNARLLGLNNACEAGMLMSVSVPLMVCRSDTEFSGDSLNR